VVNLAIVKFIIGWRDIARIHEKRLILFKERKKEICWRRILNYLGTDGRIIIEFILKLVH
jgi:hypothetical protein